MIRFEAQLALCQVAIEENTRPLAPESQRVVKPAPVIEGRTLQSPEQADSSLASITDSETPQAISQERTATAAHQAMTMPPGQWHRIDSLQVAGRFEVISVDERESWMTDMKTGSPTLAPRHGGVWLGLPSGAGRLLQIESYRWAESFEQLGHLVASRSGKPALGTSTFDRLAGSKQEGECRATANVWLGECASAARVQSCGIVATDEDGRRAVLALSCG